MIEGLFYNQSHFGTLELGIWSLTCAGLGPELRNLTPDYKSCSHVAFRGALGYWVHSAVGPIAAIKQSAREVRVGPDSGQTQRAAAVAFLFDAAPEGPRDRV
jgi:hypothetical protein